MQFLFLCPYVFDIFTFWIIKFFPTGLYDSFVNAVPFYAKRKDWEKVSACEVVMFFSMHVPDGFSFSSGRDTKK